MESQNTSDMTNVNPKPSTVSLALVLNLGISCFFLFTAVLAVIYVRSVMRQHALEEAESQTRIILDHNLATHTYFSHDLKPAVFELTDPYISPDYFDPTWMSSTYAVREIDRYYRTLSDEDYYYKEAAINARNPQNEADAFEREFIEALNADPSVVDQSLVRTLNGKPYFVTIRRGEVLESSCLRCHSTPENAPSELIDLYGPERSFQRDVGEVISAISIRIPLSEAYASVDQVTWQLSGIMLLFLFSLFLIQAFVYARFVLRPLGHMREKARQIAAGDVPVGEQIALPFGKELAELTGAFNSMSAALHQEKELLEERIQERTLSLARTNQELQEDIAARLRAEEALQEKMEELDRFFSSALDLLCIANVDGYFLRLNTEWETTLGYRLEDLEGKRFLDLVHPDDLESTLGAIAELSADRQITNFVNRYRCQDGSYRWIEWRSVPYQSRLIYAAARDITQRRQMEEALRQSEEQYRTLFDQSINALLLCETVVDEQGAPTDFVLLQINRAFEDSVNLRSQDIVGQRLMHVLPDIKDTPLFNAMIRTAATRQPDQLEFYSVSLSRYFDVGVFSPHQGQVAISYTDITARKQVEEHKARLALEQEKARILRSFVEDVSHEFRTPLTVIHTGLELLERMAAQQRTQSPERIAELQEQTMYISDLVDAMLTMTKLDSVSSLPATATSINSVVATVAEAFQSYTAKKEVALRLETMEESPLVLGVSDELERAVGNLVKNAIQFTPPNGVITLRTSADSHHAIIEISDTGTGISEEALPLIFERFYRANTARTGRHAGLGLAIAKRIIELHGGQIEVTSQLNEGSTFRVLLPLTNETKE
ncbi:MAG: DUF3365 domain-containing protein [Anaerolineales bacterium]|nr:DUF3365 domain-containing protein [Anaerolineales bacterium]